MRIGLRKERQGKAFGGLRGAAAAKQLLQLLELAGDTQEAS